MRRVVVTGMGIWSCLGKNKEEVAVSLREGRSGIGIQPERTEYGYRSPLTGIVEKPQLKGLLDRKLRMYLAEEGEYAYMATLEAFKQAGVDDAYLLDTEQGISLSYEHNAHLWTIQDAKDGDVLVYGDNPNDHHVEVIMIFKSLRNERSAFTHFHIFDDRFRTDDWSACGKNVHPATKEQRDILFAKMKEEGYEWDAKKKELIRLNYKK